MSAQPGESQISASYVVRVRIADEEKLAELMPGIPKDERFSFAIECIRRTVLRAASNAVQYGRVEEVVADSLSRTVPDQEIAEKQK